MQSLILPPAPFITTPQFGLPRLDPDRERIPLSRPRSTHARGYSPRALPPPRLMSGSGSGSGPKDDPLDVSGHARRQRHADLDFPEPLATTRPAMTTAATAATTSTAAPTTTTTTPPGSLATPTLPAPSSHDKAHGSLSSLHDEPSPRWPPPPYAFQGLSQPQELSYPPGPVSVTTSSSPGTATAGLSQKPTRRTKAHVASACVNCKKKHLGCDAARPCRRCVLSGKAATCVDVTHKKRGRPPLKAEDASVRQYATRIEHPVAPGDPAAQPRRSLHRTSGSREIRPVTDLQMPGAHPVQALGMGVGHGHGPPPPPPHRWSTSVYPHAVDPALTMPVNPGPGPGPGLGHRRFSSSGSLSSTGYAPMAETMSPVFGSRVPPMARPPSSYTTSSVQHQQQYPSNTSSPTYQHFYGGSPYMSRAPMPMGESPVSRDHQGPGSSYMGSPVKLPPIFPPGPGPGPAAGPGPGSGPGSGSGSTTSPSGHRLSDHYPAANWSPRTHERPPPAPPASSSIPTNAPQPPQQPGLMDPISPPHTQQVHHHHHHHHLHHLPPATPEFSYPPEYIQQQQQPPTSLPRPPESVTPASGPASSSYRRSIHMPSPSSTTPTTATTAPTFHARDEPPSSGAEAEAGRDEGDRPTKRRKMALDDMVND